MKILSQSFYNRPTLKVAQDLLGCFLVRRLKNTPFNKGGVGGFKTPSLRPSRIGEAEAERGGLGGVLKYKIVETEAYNGPNDLASHASIGRTERNKIMFDEPGTIYVYLTYGIHYMLNIVTEEKDYPAAVLIRAVEPISRCHCERSEAISARRAKRLDNSFHEQPTNRDCFVAPKNAGLLAMTTNGPAKLTKSLKIDKTFNGLPIYPIRKKSSNGASTKKHNLWIENRKENLKPSQIVKTTRVGIDYAKGYKDKKWRFYIKENKFVSVQ